MKLIVARHGESVWNRKGIIQGQLDSPLTELGQRQVAALCQALADINIDHIYSSPASRAVASAERLAKQFHCAINLDARLHERHYGVLQGQSYQSLRNVHSEMVQPLLAGNPQVTPPSGESINEVCDRSLSCLHQLYARHPQETLLLVTHGDVLEVIIWALKGRQNDDDLHRYSHQNASYARLEITEQGITLNNWGVGTHLLKVI